MTDKLIATDGTSSGLSAGAAISDTDYIELQQSVVSPASTVNSQFSAIKTWVKSWIAKADVGLGSVANSLQLVAANNLSDLTDAPAARNNMGGFQWLDPDFALSSNIYLTPWIPFGAGAGSMAANTLYMIPVWVPHTRTYSTYALILTTLSGTSSIRSGLYNANQSTLQPTTKIDEGASLIDASTGTGATGIKTVAFSVNQSLKPGLYYLAAVSDGTPSVIRYGANSNAVGPLGTVFGASSLTSNDGKSRAFTFAALPSDESAQTYTANGPGAGHPPVVGIK